MRETSVTGKHIAYILFGPLTQDENLIQILEASYKNINLCLNKLNQDFVNVIVSNIKPAEIENHQMKRRKEGLKPKTIDDEINYVKTMVIKAFDNDKISGGALKTLKRVKCLLKKKSNRRDKILTAQEFQNFHEQAKAHLKDILTIGYWTGMRKGEIDGGFIFHDLRHGFVTEMRRAGVPRSVTMSLTGHVPKDMNDRYDTVNDQGRFDAVRALERFRSVDQVPENLSKFLRLFENFGGSAWESNSYLS